jgi:hypothetical protein
MFGKSTRQVPLATDSSRGYYLSHLDQWLLGEGVRSMGGVQVNNLLRRPGRSACRFRDVRLERGR